MQHCVKLVLIFSVSNSLFISAEEGRMVFEISPLLPNYICLHTLEFSLSQQGHFYIHFPLKNCIFFVIQFNGLCVNKKKEKLSASCKADVSP